LAFTANNIELQDSGVVAPEPATREEVFLMVEQSPEFPGGLEALYKYIGENLHYPAVARENGIQGKVTIRFVIEKTGAVSEVEVLRGFDAACDAEAVRVIKSLPKFKPGKHGGRTVRVFYTIPLSFKLQTEESKEPQQTFAEFSKNAIDKKEAEKKDSDEVFVSVEQAPEFPGGMQNLYRYIGNHLRYPVQARDKGIQGETSIRFVIEKDGSVSDVIILCGFQLDCDLEAARVITNLPKFTPGMQDEKPVRVSYTIPITFKLGEGQSNTPPIFTEVEKDPEFPGGIEALFAYISTNTQYPPVAVKDKIQGKTTILCVIEQDGTVSEVAILQGFDTDCDAEAMRVIKSLPKFTPAKIEGKSVRVYYTIPITFKLNNEENTADEEESNLDKIYMTVEKYPEFPGGIAALYKYIGEHLHYPAIARLEGIEGRVTLRFVVEKDGSVSDIQVLRGFYVACDVEAVRVVKSLPKFTPGIQYGKPVRTFFTIPITFELSQ
jgi:TonB family protein